MNGAQFRSLIVNRRPDMDFDFVDTNLIDSMHEMTWDIDDKVKKEKIQNELYEIQKQLSNKLEKVNFIYQSFIKALITEYKQKGEKALKQ